LLINSAKRAAAASAQEDIDAESGLVVEEDPTPLPSQEPSQPDNVEVVVETAKIVPETIGEPIEVADVQGRPPHVPWTTDERFVAQPHDHGEENIFDTHTQITDAEFNQARAVVGVDAVQDDDQRPGSKADSIFDTVQEANEIEESIPALAVVVVVEDVHDDQAPSDLQTCSQHTSGEVVDEALTPNECETTKQTQVAEPRPGSASINGRALQGPQGLLSTAAGIATTHVTRGVVGVIGVEAEVPRADEENMLNEPLQHDEARTGYRKWGLPTTIIVDREGDYYIERSAKEQSDVIARVLVCREDVMRQYQTCKQIQLRKFTALPRVLTDNIYQTLYDDLGP